MSMSEYQKQRAPRFRAAPVWARLEPYKNEFVARETGISRERMRMMRTRGVLFDHRDAEAIVRFLRAYTGRTVTRTDLFLPDQVRYPSQRRLGWSPYGDRGACYVYDRPAHNVADDAAARNAKEAVAAL